MAIQKKYQHRIFNAAGVYLGLIPPSTIVSDFNYNQTIATAGTQVGITIAQSPDTAALPVSTIDDELGNPLQTEDSNNLQIERQPDAVGSGNSKNLIQNGNQIQIYEISQYYPNGILKFNGYISKWKATFSGDNHILVTCISNGQDLSNTIIQTGDTPSINQTTDNGSTINLVYDGGAKGLGYQGAYQTIIPGSTISAGGIAVEIQTSEPGTLSIGLYAGGGLLGGSIASGSVHLGTISKSVQKVTFNTPTSITSGSTYSFWVNWVPDSGSNTAALLFYNSTNPYASGGAGTVSFAGTHYDQLPISNADLYFIIYAHGTSTTAPYTSKDPSFILTDIMSNYKTKGGLVSIPSVTVTPFISALNSDAQFSAGYWGDAFSQIFTPAKNMTINIVQLFLAVSSGNYNLSLSIVQGDPALDTASVMGGHYTYTFGGSNTIIASSNFTSFNNAVGAVTSFTFNTPVNLVAGTKYYIHIEWGQGEYGNLLTYGSSGTDIISDTQVGHLYASAATINNASAYPAYNSSFPALYFTLAYLNPLPTNLSGGYGNTGVTATYSFKLNTVLEGIQQVYNLGPSNWYWYVDPATNILYYQASNTKADIVLVKGKHLNSLEIEATRESIVNDVYFSGGDDGTGTQTNILVEATDAASLAANRKGLARISDNRVTSTTGGVTTAKALAAAYIAKNNAETYITSVTVQDGTMDINKIQLGMMVGFANFGTFVDQLLMQVVGLTYNPDQITLQLGSLPKAQTSVIQSLLNQITALQTGNNPASPS